MVVKRMLTERFVPSLETLSDRVVPSCTWVEENGTLTITGDQGANVVDIVDDGTALTITCDGEDVPLAGEVENIVLKLGSGNDEVTYTLQGALAADAVRTLDACLGNGMDTFTAVLEDGTDDVGGTVDSALGDNAVLDLIVRGMNGKDALNFAAASTDVGAGASLSVVFTGGNAKDALDVVYGGLLLGDLTLMANGNNGKDNLAVDATVDATSTGNVDVEALGGNGPDALAVFVLDNSGDDGDDSTVDASTLSSLSAVANGERGPDWVEASDTVEVLGAKLKEHP